MIGLLRKVFGHKKNKDRPKQKNKYAENIKSIQTEIGRAEEKGFLNKGEAIAIKTVIPDLETENISTFAWESMMVRHLKEMWNPELKLIREQKEAEERERARNQTEDSSWGVRFSRAGPEWYIGLTNEFTKAISKIDKKLQGRVLEALGKIVKAPIVSSGNTIKPLTGNKKGLWRYRIGDFRLVYQPDLTKKHILMLTVLPRGSAYE